MQAAELKRNYRFVTQNATYIEVCSGDKLEIKGLIVIAF